MIDTEALLRHGTFVRNLARRLVRDAHTAEDLARFTRRGKGGRKLVGTWFGALARGRELPESELPLHSRPEVDAEVPDSTPGASTKTLSGPSGSQPGSIAT